MIQNIIVTLLVISAFLMIVLILLQPDRSQGLGKNANYIADEKEGIEKFTEYVAISFLVLAVLAYVVS